MVGRHPIHQMKADAPYYWPLARWAFIYSCAGTSCPVVCRTPTCLPHNFTHTKRERERERERHTLSLSLSLCFALLARGYISMRWKDLGEYGVMTGSKGPSL